MYSPPVSKQEIPPINSTFWTSKNSTCVSSSNEELPARTNILALISSNSRDGSSDNRQKAQRLLVFIKRKFRYRRAALLIILRGPTHAPHKTRVFHPPARFITHRLSKRQWLLSPSFLANISRERFISASAISSRVHIGIRTRAPRI